MNKKLSLWLVLAFLPFTTACSLQEIGALNPNFLDPLHDLLFKNEFQVNDFQYLFDASNQTISIRRRRMAETVDNIYGLELISNPLKSQGIYRMRGGSVYDGFIMGIEYTEASNNFFQTKVVIQESEIKARDALDTWTTNVYVNTEILSYPLFRMSAGGTWVRVSTSGIYNSLSSDHYTFIYNDLVDQNVQNEDHSMRVVNIAGNVTNTFTYKISLITNLSSTAAVYYVRSPNPAAPLESQYLGFDIASTIGGVPMAKIITSGSSITPNPALLDAFIATLNNSPLLDHTTLSSIDRPDLQLLPLREKGPWVAVTGNSYNFLNTTNWVFSVQDQSVTISIYKPGGSTTPVVQSATYALNSTPTKSVFQLKLVSGNGPFNNLYFGFKSRIRNTENFERFSFYLESSESATANRISSSSFADNYANIYKASSLGGAVSGVVKYKLKVSPSLPDTVVYENALGIRNKLFGATVFTREENGREYVYVLGGAENTTALSLELLYEIAGDPTILRNRIARSPNLGIEQTIGAVSRSSWEDVNFLFNYDGPVIAPFGGQYAWIGNRLFIYNPAKYTTLSKFDEIDANISPNFRLISTSTFNGNWILGGLPGALTNRPHANFFAAQGGILVLTGGLHFTENSHSPATPEGTYTITNDVWHSYNNGSSWNRVANKSDYTPRYMSTVLTMGSDTFLLGGYTADTAAGGFSDEIWKTSDGGLTWTQIQGSLPTAIVNSYNFRKNGRMPGFVINNMMYIVAANNDPDGTYPTAPMIYSSIDGGVTWQGEEQIDTQPGGGVPANRGAGILGTGYVWSANNAKHKGVLFSIGGIKLDAGGGLTINPNVYLRTLEPTP